MNEALTELAEYIDSALPGEVLEWTVAHDELTIVVGAASVVRVLTFLRDDSNCPFKQLVDLCGTDYRRHLPEQLWEAYLAADAEAKSTRRGIWCGKFIEPRMWRRGDRLACERSGER